MERWIGRQLPFSDDVCDGDHTRFERFDHPGSQSFATGFSRCRCAPRKNLADPVCQRYTLLAERGFEVTEFQVRMRIDQARQQRAITQFKLCCFLRGTHAGDFSIAHIHPYIGFGSLMGRKQESRMEGKVLRKIMHCHPLDDVATGRRWFKAWWRCMLDCQPASQKSKIKK